MQTIANALQQIASALQNGVVASAVGIGTPAANSADFTLASTAVATLRASTIKGIQAIGCSDGSFGVFILPIGSTTPVLFMGTSGEVMASPTSGFWGIAYSGGNWQISNQTAGSLSFWKWGLLGG